ncbi:hypothetical protein SMICM304S_05501 [Streptomyces microflavus]
MTVTRRTGKKLKANGVKVVDGWEQAYNEEFSGSAGGKKAKADRPLVVGLHASSPPVEVLYADPQPKEAPTGVSTGTCFRQTEYAGLLKGAKNEAGGKALLDFLISKTFQEGRAAEHVREPGRDGREAAGDLHRVRRDRRQAGQRRPPTRSPPTVSSGSGRGTRSS